MSALVAGSSLWRCGFLRCSPKTPSMRRMPKPTRLRPRSSSLEAAVGLESGSRGTEGDLVAASISPSCRLASRRMTGASAAGLLCWPSCFFDWLSCSTRRLMKLFERFLMSTASGVPLGVFGDATATATALTSTPVVSSRSAPPGAGLPGVCGASVMLSRGLDFTRFFGWPKSHQ